MKEASDVEVPSLALYIVLIVWAGLRNHPFLILLHLIAIRFFFRKYASPLRNYPGPFVASGSRVWKGILSIRTHK